MVDVHYIYRTSQKLKMDPIRVIGQCSSSNMWYEPSSSSTIPGSSQRGSTWHGMGMWTLSDLGSRLPPLQIIPFNGSNEGVLKSIANGIMDVSPGDWGVTYEARHITMLKSRQCSLLSMSDIILYYRHHTDISKYTVHSVFIFMNTVTVSMGLIHLPNLLVKVLIDN
jgi:hypothetical protein